MTSDPRLLGNFILINTQDETQQIAEWLDPESGELWRVPVINGEWLLNLAAHAEEEFSQKEVNERADMHIKLFSLDAIDFAHVRLRRALYGPVVKARR